MIKFELGMNAAMNTTDERFVERDGEVLCFNPDHELTATIWQNFVVQSGRWDLVWEFTGDVDSFETKEEAMDAFSAEMENYEG